MARRRGAQNKICRLIHHARQLVFLKSDQIEKIDVVQIELEIRAVALHVYRYRSYHRSRQQQHVRDVSRTVFRRIDVASDLQQRQLLIGPDHEGRSEEHTSELQSL